MPVGKSRIPRLCKQTLWRLLFDKTSILPVPLFRATELKLQVTLLFTVDSHYHFLARLDDEAQGYGTDGQDRERVIPTFVG